VGVQFVCQFVWPLQQQLLPPMEAHSENQKGARLFVNCLDVLCCCHYSAPKRPMQTTSGRYPVAASNAIRTLFGLWMSFVVEIRKRPVRVQEIGSIAWVSKCSITGFGRRTGCPTLGGANNARLGRAFRVSNSFVAVLDYLPF